MHKTKSKKSYTVAVCLSAVFGITGLQHFYLGRYFLGLADLSLSILTFYFFISGHFFYALLFFGLDFFHSFVITVRLLTGSFEDGEGGISAVLKELSGAGLIHEDCLTVSGKRIGEEIAKSATKDSRVIRPVRDPYRP